MKKPVPFPAPVVGKIDPSKIPPLNKWKLNYPVFPPRLVFRTKPTSVIFVQLLTEWSPFYDENSAELMPTGYANISFKTEIAESPLYPYPLADRSLDFALTYGEEKDGVGSENGVLRPSLRLALGGEMFTNELLPGKPTAGIEMINKSPEFVIFPALDPVADLPIMQGAFAGFPAKGEPSIPLRVAFSKKPIVTKYHYRYVGQDSFDAGILLDSPDLTSHMGKPIVHDLLYKVEYLSGTVTDCVVEVLQPSPLGGGKEDNFGSEYGPGLNDFVET